MEPDEIIQHILVSRKDLKRVEVLKMIEDKKKEAKGYFTTKGATLIVAKELGVQISREPLRSEIQIEDLVSGLNDVTLTGCVKAFYPPRTFFRSNGTEGKIARLLVTDKSGDINVVIWDENAETLEDGKISKGKTVKILHGYVREGLGRKLEIHVGSRGRIQILKESLDLSSSFLQIANVKRESKKVNIIGVVQRVYPTHIFKRSDGTQGKVKRLELKDKTGQITIVFWNLKVDRLGEIKEGDCLQIEDAKVRETLDRQLEINTINVTQIKKLDERPQNLRSFSDRFMRITDLRSNMRDVRVLARVICVGEIRKFLSSRKKTGQVSTLLLKDDTGHIYLNFWSEKATFSRQVKPGDLLLVEGAYTRDRFGKINLNMGERGNLVLNPEVEASKKLPQYKEKPTEIADIREEDWLVTVNGKLTKAPVIREVETARGNRAPVATFEVADETGNIKVAVWRGLVDVVKNLKAGNCVKIRRAYVKSGVADRLELTSQMFTSVEYVKNVEKSEGEIV
jgi:ssDNA-binding replication factor A large subunit